ncbi:hypothetical protein STSO111631_16665 [Stackebrandtia soli]
MTAASREPAERIPSTRHDHGVTVPIMAERIADTVGAPP